MLGDHAAHIELVCEPIKVAGGEKIKNELFHVEWMQGLIQTHRIDRHSFVIAIGGGAVLDAVGLVAATSHRGIRTHSRADHCAVAETILASA